MPKVLVLAMLAALAGCAGLPEVQRSVSACSAGEASYACQVERYHDVAVD